MLPSSHGIRWALPDLLKDRLVGSTLKHRVKARRDRTRAHPRLSGYLWDDAEE